MYTITLTENIKLFPCDSRERRFEFTGKRQNTTSVLKVTPTMKRRISPCKEQSALKTTRVINTTTDE